MPTAPVPAKPKPKAVVSPRMGRHWRWVRDEQLPTGQFVCVWQRYTGANGVGNLGHGTVRCAERTLRLIEQTDEGTDELMDAREEAKRDMKTVMRDVGHLASTAPIGTVQAGRRPKAPNGVKSLRDAAVVLVQDMRKTPSPTPEQLQEFAERYGRQRDAMRELREAFAETEGAFETAQQILMAQLED